MAGNPQPIPEGFHSLTPHLIVRDAPRAMEFYKNAFGAELLGPPHMTPDGKVMHASLKIGDSALMLNEEFPDWGAVSPLGRGGTSVTIHLYVADVDAVFDRAIATGAKVEMPLMDAFWGDRYGTVLDPFGHHWSLATHKEDLSQPEIEKRGAAAFPNMSQPPGKASA